MVRLQGNYNLTALQMNRNYYSCIESNLFDSGTDISRNLGINL